MQRSTRWRTASTTIRIRENLRSTCRRSRASRMAGSSRSISPARRTRWSRTRPPTIPTRSSSNASPMAVSCSRSRTVSPPARRSRSNRGCSVADPHDQTVASQPSAATESEGDEAYCAPCNNSFTLDHMFCPNDGAKLVKLKARADTLLGRVFDNRYEIRSALGHGGMGTVYRGWQMSVDREVAIKVIHPKLASVRQVAKRFLREARLSSRLNQPNIVNVYDFGQTDDGI